MWNTLEASRTTTRTAMMNSGSAITTRTVPDTTESTMPPGCLAASMPRISTAGMSTAEVIPTSTAELTARSAISWVTGVPEVSEEPRFRVSRCPIHSVYWLSNGLSRPR